MKQIYVNRWSERGRRLKKALNSREDVVFVGVHPNRRQLVFNVEESFSIRWSRRGKLYINRRKV